MKDRCLITTPLQESWDFDKPVLFLGEWCKLYSCRSDWRSLDYETVPYHWNDRDKLYKDYDYLMDLYEKILNQLSVQLNAFHKVDRTKNYWRIILGPWLSEFIGACFDRWETIAKAFSEYNISETTILEIENYRVVPNDMLQFTSLIVSDEWNHFLYGQILKTIKPNINIHHKELSIYKDKKNDDHTLSLQKKVKINTRFFLERLTGHMLKSSKYFFIDTFLSGADQSKLEISLKSFPSYFLNKNKNDDYCINDNDRNGINIIDISSNEFEEFVTRIISKQIPRAYVEGYKKLLAQVESSQWPSSPKVIMTCGAHIGNDFFKIWAANKISEGSKLVIGQHASVYGSGKFFAVEEHEIKISDRYFSWGWVDNNVVANSPARIINAKKIFKHDSAGGVLLALTSWPRYCYHLFASPISSQVLDYATDQITFAQCLLNKTRSHLTVRQYPVDYDWNQKERWKSSFPEVKFDSNRPLYETMAENRLLVCSSNSSVLMESMSANIPTVIFWNPSHSELRESAAPYFELLVSANILHYSPESAASFINKIWDDVDLWWYSEETQKVRREFCKQFARSRDDWKSEWIRNLEDLTSLV
jgi:putative transferase (TIGR04331 family)